MKKWMQHFTELNIWVKIILGFCLFGVFANAVLVCRDLLHEGVLLRLHAGFLLLYLAQTIFILVPERMVCVLAALQGILALLINADFTFMPIVRLIGRCVYLLSPEVGLENLKEYRYVVVSAAFTLQMLSAFALFTLLPKNEPKQPAEN
ncbi:MAG: hypothetical protein IKP06_02850 [Elusimicrobiaceae bacterium]|nr:hypothetical protein [Elusimicrobiaceae bacterium]